MVVWLGLGIDAPGKDGVYRAKAKLLRIRSAGEKSGQGQRDRLEPCEIGRAHV